MFEENVLGDMRDLISPDASEYGAPPATDPKLSNKLGKMDSVAMSLDVALQTYGKFMTRIHEAPKKDMSKKEAPDLELETLKGNIIHTFRDLNPEYVFAIDAMSMKDFLFLQELNKDLLAHRFDKNVLEELLSHYLETPEAKKAA